ncbi:hypothetical protein C462_16416 [Halorubrum distributum JCM 13916]|uniref:Uncharacterized protein n=1 Tax=Halorubrum distributum JCM 13916 TaxID=1230455 RepID=M0PAS7_9EURY|nr:hypothetical protein C462_16416 [Halorubrum arcis JCM 13916]
MIGFFLGMCLQFGEFGFRSGSFPLTGFSVEKYVIGTDSSGCRSQRHVEVFHFVGSFWEVVRAIFFTENLLLLEDRRSIRKLSHIRNPLDKT